MNSEKSAYNPEKVEGQPPVYEVKEIDSPILEHYQPQYLAKGGEHIVYKVPNHPEVVVKVIVETVKKIFKYNIENKLPADSLSSGLKSISQEYIKKEANRFKQLENYFGKDHVLQQRKQLSRLPVNERILMQLFKSHPPANIKEVYGVTMVQTMAPEASDERRIEITSGYWEKSDVDADIYREITNPLLIGQDIDSHRLESVALSAPLQKVLEKVKADPVFSEQLTQFIKQCIIYTQETGEILDLVGNDNVIFSDQSGEWNYKLIDALYPKTDQMLGRIQAVIRKLSLKELITPEDNNHLLNGVNYIRFINGLASYLDINEKIRVVPEDIAIEDIDLLQVIRAGHMP